MEINTKNINCITARIPLGFYNAEVRNGFYISPHIKQAWAQQLKVLSVIDDICRRHDILYFADWGTLLGAIRHGGYVPWDDDIDVCMRRQDYDSFMEAASTELPDGFDVYTFRNKKDHWLFISKVVNKNRMCFEEEHLNQYDNFPYIASVDIFIQDYLYRDEEKEKDRKDRIMWLLAVAEMVITGTIGSVAKSTRLAEIADKYHVEFKPGMSDFDIGIIIYDIIEKIMSEVPEAESDKMGQIFPWILKGGQGIKKEYFSKAERLPFEFTDICVPCAYHDVMTWKFGNYLNVVKGVGAHDYPFYEGQKKSFLEVAKSGLPEFTITQSMIKAAAETRKIRLKRAAENHGRKTVFFFPVSGKAWETMVPFYKKHTAEVDTDIFVVPLPLFCKDIYGRLSGEVLYDLDEYPEDLPGYLYKDIEMESFYSDVIYIQDPYDCEGPVLTVPREFYSDRLMRHCDVLALVAPTGITSTDSECDRYNAVRFINTPGALNSDIIYTSSEQLKVQYTDIMKDITGDETLNYWEDKIKIMDLSGEERNKMDQSAKTILYCIGLNEIFEYGDGKLQAAIRQRLSAFAQRLTNPMRVKIYLFPPNNSLWNDDKNKISKEIRQILEEYDDDSRFVLANTQETESLSDECVAYYGAPSPLVLEFTERGKPVMISSEDAVQY